MGVVGALGRYKVQVGRAQSLKQAPTGEAVEDSQRYSSPPVLQYSGTP